MLGFKKGEFRRESGLKKHIANQKNQKRVLSQERGGWRGENLAKVGGNRWGDGRKKKKPKEEKNGKADSLSSVIRCCV